jgi:hypothetical protein
MRPRALQNPLKNAIEYPPVPAVHTAVKTKLSATRLFRLVALPLVLAFGASSVGCVTTYDPYGRPVQTVDPAVAVAGVAAAGLIGYAIGDSRGGSCYHGGGYYYPGYCY